ncbi:hypothetical protein F5Y07DRAFT_359809 [Xylaria sp. FL0933]|nr:hypothetical protein F5Y07DRAFT_359809 [Xylaria sp. FL0933]
MTMIRLSARSTRCLLLLLLVDSSKNSTQSGVLHCLMKWRGARRNPQARSFLCWIPQVDGHTCLCMVGRRRPSTLSRPASARVGCQRNRGGRLATRNLSIYIA